MPPEFLPQLSAALAAAPDLPTLMTTLTHLLQPHLPFDHLGLFLHDPAAGLMRLHLCHSAAPSDTTPIPGFPVDNSPSGHVFTTQQPLLIPSTADDGRWPHVLSLLSANHVRTFCLLPLSTPTRPLGALSLGHHRPGAYAPDDLPVLQAVAAHAAPAVAALLPHA